MNNLTEIKQLKFEFPSNMIIIGATGSGKSFAFKNLFYYHFRDKFDVVYLFGSTVNLSNDYDYIPDEYKFDVYSPEMVMKIIQVAEHQVKNGNKKRIAIIFDDSINFVSFQNNRLYDGLFSKSRHLGISVFVIIQHIKFCSPCIRNNTGYVLVTKTHAENLDTLYELQHVYPSKKEFKSVMLQKMVNFNVIVFNNKDVYENKGYIFRANPKLPKFKLDY